VGFHMESGCVLGHGSGGPTRGFVVDDVVVGEWNGMQEAWLDPNAEAYQLAKQNE